MPEPSAPRGWTIRAQLTAAFLCFALLSGAVGGVALARLYDGAHQAAIAEATEVAETLAFVFSDGEHAQGPLIDDSAKLQAFVAELHDSQGRDVAVVDGRQVILADAVPEDVGLEFTDDAGDEIGFVLAEGEPRAFLEQSAAYPDGIRLLAAPLIESDGQVVGAVIYEYTPPYNALIAQANITAIGIAIATLLVVMLAVVVAFVLGRRLAASLETLTSAVSDMGNGDFGSRLPLSGIRELADLTRAIEGQRHQLDQRIEVALIDAERSRSLTRLGEMIAFSDGEDELLEAAIGTIERLIASTGGNLLLLNPSEDRLTVGGVWGTTAGEPGAVVPIDRPSRCPGIRRGSPYVVADASDRLQAHCRAFPTTTGSLLCIPMLALGKVVGVIHVYADQPGAFDDRDREVVTRVAEQSALALSNARLIKSMEGLAMTDNLTGLYNGRFFDPLLERELAVAERDGVQVGVIMLDLDHFKGFNDTHGHPAGDEALKAFARAAQGALRESDVIARYGGEEFVVMARGADLQGTAIIAEKVRAAVEGTVVNVGPGRTARITVSAGVSSTAGHGQDRMVLLRVADEALYQAKQEGRNRVVVSQPLFAMRDGGRAPIVRRPPARKVPSADVVTASSSEPATISD